MEARSSQFESGSIIVGYRIDELIGRGGMGVVYRATNVALNRIYALKVLAPELVDDEQFRERFKREMRIAASLHHPNVVGIHYAGEHDGLLFLVMDFISGTDLRQVMEKSGPIESHRANQLLTQLASALDAAHGRGLVHRDVKPANVLIAVNEGEERAYLTDFGLAKRFDSESSIASLTQTGVVIGTVDYMSPEQITGGHTDARTDIYALGCVFFQMLTGQVPYQRQDSVATLYAHVHEPPPALERPLDELYPTFGAVIERAMAKDPDERYLSAGDFARDAAAALCGSRYTGPQTVVATGEARPPLNGQDAIEPTVADRETEPGSPPAQKATAAHAGPEAALTAEPAASTVPPGRVPDPAGGWLRRHRWLALAGVLVACGAIAVVIALSPGGSPSGPAGKGSLTPLSAVPTNRVTGSGTATVQIKDDLAAVTVDTNGLIATPHLMHIHGGTGNCPSPLDARYHTPHHYLAIGWSEGNKVYGHVVTSLTESSNTTDPSAYLDSGLYQDRGNIRYSRTIRLAPGVASLIRNGLAVIVVHGIDYNGNGRYDDVLGGTSGGEYNTATEEATAPALCGHIVPTPTAAAGRRSGATYVAALQAYDGGDLSKQSPAQLLLCHAAAVPGNLPLTAALSRTRAAA